MSRIRTNVLLVPFAPPPSDRSTFDATLEFEPQRHTSVLEGLSQSPETA